MVGVLAVVNGLPQERAAAAGKQNRNINSWPARDQGAAGIDRRRRRQLHDDRRHPRPWRQGDSEPLEPALYAASFTTDPHDARTGWATRTALHQGRHREETAGEDRGAGQQLMPAGLRASPSPFTMPTVRSALFAQADAFHHARRDNPTRRRRIRRSSSRRAATT